ncbi:MAG: LysR substrate-binding domain-containing protein [Hyphomicrobiaceae bacterium]
MNLRHLAYLVALSRERNFRRAAAVSNISQPTLSAALRQLEDEFGLPLVQRSRQRFEGFTPEGVRVLDAARRMLADVENLKQNVTSPKGQLSGHLRIGIIPTAEPLAGQITAAFHARQPNVTITLLSKTSNEIQRGILEHELEAGITYVGQTVSAEFEIEHLYDETYVVIGSEVLLGATRTSITWREAARLPLVLLNREMRNRQLVDQSFADVRAVARVQAESSTLVGILSHVRQGQWCGIVPGTFAVLLGAIGSLRSLALIEPDVSHAVGIQTLARRPRAPLAEALIGVLRDLPAIAGGIANSTDRIS